MAPDLALHICRTSGPAAVNGRPSVTFADEDAAASTWPVSILAKR
jgi:hypothetical protein